VNLNTLDLNLLRVFEALIRDRSVSAAAERLRLTQPATSNALNRLRQFFGDPLFVRTRNGMEPTAIALALRDSVSDALAMIRGAVERSGGFDPKTSDRTFTLIMNDVGEITFLPTLLERLAKAAPFVDLRVRELGREDHEEALDSGAADIAVGRIKLSDTFRSQLLLLSTYVAVLSRDHPLVRRRKRFNAISYEDYLAARHVAVHPRGASGNPLERGLGADASRRRIALSIPHTTVLPSLLPGTELVATVPDSCIDLLCRDGRLVWAKLPFEMEPVRVMQWWHKRQDQDAGHLWLREQLSSV
jgi:DNA-binding transcriptional LysR family regulator